MDSDLRFKVIKLLVPNILFISLFFPLFVCYFRLAYYCNFNVFFGSSCGILAGLIFKKPALYVKFDIRVLIISQ